MTRPPLSRFKSVSVRHTSHFNAVTVVYSVFFDRVTSLIFQPVAHNPQRFVSTHPFLARKQIRSLLKPDASWIRPALHPSPNLLWSEESIWARKWSRRPRRRQRIPGRRGAFSIPPSGQHTRWALFQHATALLEKKQSSQVLTGSFGGRTRVTWLRGSDRFVNFG